MNQIVEPFGVSVEASFRRVEIIANLMEYFLPTMQQWQGTDTSTMEQVHFGEEDI